MQDNAANAGPTPGDPFPSPQERLERIDGRRRDSGVELPADFGRTQPGPVAPAVDPVAELEAVDEVVEGLQKQLDAQADPGHYDTPLEWRTMDSLSGDWPPGLAID